MKVKANLSLPLDFLYPKVFGKMDEDEKELIKEYGALDLVLIENASELFRRALQKEKIFERILHNLVKAQNNPNIKYLESETFPFYVSREIKKSFYKAEKAAMASPSQKKKYEDTVFEYRKKINRKYKYVAIIAVDLESSGGHYAAIYYSDNKVTLFDSMQTDISEAQKDVYSETVISASEYTHYFYQLVSDIFPNATIEIPDCIKKEVSLQYTGGFLEDLPYFLEKLDPSAIDDETRRRLILQTTESQNHFCYMWSIWWIHLKLRGLDFATILNLFKQNDPLIVIKKYGWSIVNCLNIPVEHLDFFNKHFMSIWSNGKENKLSIDFKRYDIPKPPHCENDINNAFIESIRDLNLVEVSNTLVPEELKRALK
jgi:hypothetical protein